MASNVIITSRGKLDKEVVAETPSGMPDILVTPLSVVERLAIKFCKVYFSSLVAFLGATVIGVVPGVDPVPLNGFIAVFMNAAQLALVPAIGTVVLNASIFFTKLDDKTPELMA